MATTTLTQPGSTSPKKKRISTNTIVLWLILIPIVIVLVTPVWYMVAKAFTPEANQFKYPIVWVPDPFSLVNFQTIFGDRS